MKGKRRGGRLLEGGHLIEGDTYKVNVAIAQQFKRKTPRVHRAGNNGNEKAIILVY